MLLRSLSDPSKGRNVKPFLYLPCWKDLVKLFLVWKYGKSFTSWHPVCQTSYYLCCPSLFCWFPQENQFTSESEQMSICRKLDWHSLLFSDKQFSRLSQKKAGPMKNLSVPCLESTWQVGIWVNSLGPCILALQLENSGSWIYIAHDKPLQLKSSSE